MITLVDSQTWAAADLTGNSALVTVGAALFVVGGRREGEGHGIYRSLDSGATWERVSIIPVTHGSSDPAVALSANGVDLHIILAKPNAATPVLTDVVLYRFSTATLVLGTPVVLVAGSRIATAYDLVTLKDAQGADAGTLVLLGAQEPTTPVGHAGKYVLFAVEVAVDNTLTHTVLEESHWSTGATCGAMTLLAPTTGDIEAFYTSHPRSFTFRDTEVTVVRRIRTAANTWTPGEVLTTYSGRFSDDKLTVVLTPNNGRAVAQAFHRWSKTKGQQTNILYGVATALQGGTSWAWRWDTLAADDYNSVKEPVIESDGTNIYLAYLNCPWLADQKLYARAGFLRVADVGANDLKLTARPGAWQGLRFKWLRGTKGTVDAVSKWAVVGIGGNDISEAGSGPALYISQFNLAPHVVLAPATLMAHRGIALTLDASGTLDPDLDSLTYTWSHNAADTEHVHLTPMDGGKKAILLVDKAIGPDPFDFTITVTVDDGQPGHQMSASALATVPYNAAPVISLPSQIPVTRNTTVDLTATVTDADGDTLTYQWTQLNGTPVSIYAAKTPTPSVRVYRMDPEGETVDLELSVSDGVNPPVTRVVSLVVSAITVRDQDAGVMARAYYTVSGDEATVAQRNTLTGAWAQADELGVTSDFYKVEVVNAETGVERFCYTSTKSFLAVVGDFTDQFRRYPPTGERILDSFHDEQDQTYLLTDKGRVLRYTERGPLNVSDWPDHAIPIGDLVSGTYRGIHVEATVAGRRVVALYGNSGVFLFQVMEDTFEVVDTFRIDMDSGILPANRVFFLRTNSIVGLKGGQILVGVVDSTGSTVEVLVDLAQRRAVGTWDRSSLLSKTVNTGEILQAPADITQGRPSAPEWEEPELVGSGLYTLLWSQRRPDLVISYEVWLGLDAALPVLFTTIPSGAIRRAAFPTQPGHTYHLTIRAQGTSAWSAFSAEQTIAT